MFKRTETGVVRCKYCEILIGPGFDSKLGDCPEIGEPICANCEKDYKLHGHAAFLEVRKVPKKDQWSITDMINLDKVTLDYRI